MINRRRLLVLIFLGLAVVMLSGCDVFRRARRVQAEPPPPFQSPITQVIGRPGMTAADIAAAIQSRQSDTRSILGQLSIIVGEARSQTRLQFDANMYFAPPDFLRVRGAADAGTLFDFMMQGDQVQVMLVPEKKIHVGTVAALRANPKLMAGLQPDDLMYSFLVDQNLYRHLTTNPGTTVQQTADHYVITVNYATGTTEIYYLRMNDLLVDKIERNTGRRQMGSVRFDGYAFYPNPNGKSTHLLPTRFEAQLPTGAVATVEARDIQPNAPREQALTIMDVPPDFQQLPL